LPTALYIRGGSMNHKHVEDIIQKQNAEVSVIFRDTNQTQIIFEHNTHVQMRSASIIKLFILAVCAKAFDDGALSPDKILDISPDALVSFSLITDLKTRNWRIDDLATLMIILSDNTATNVLIDLLGLDQINTYITDHGYKNTKLNRKMMDFESAKKGFDNYTSLHDVGKLLLKMYSDAERGSKSALWMLDVLSKQKDKCMLARFLPETVEFAHKTGLNDGVQHDVGFLKLHNKTYLLGVFMEGEPNEIKGFECIGSIGKTFYMEVQNGL